MLGLDDEKIMNFVNYDDGEELTLRSKMQKKVLLGLGLIPLIFLGGISTCKNIFIVGIFILYCILNIWLEQKSENNYYKKNICLGLFAFFFSIILYADVVLGTIYSNIVRINRIILVVGLISMYLIVVVVEFFLLRATISNHNEIYKKKSKVQYAPSLFLSAGFSGWALAHGIVSGLDNDSVILLILVGFGAIALLLSLGGFSLLKAYLILKINVD